jgi:hypothetical protein
MWKARVLGEFPEEDEFSVIPLGWIVQAQNRWLAWKESGGVLPEGTRRVVGADIARFGGDKTAFADRYGMICTSVTKMPKMDTFATAELLAQRLNTARGDLGVVDSNGVGAGVYDIVKKMGKYAMPVNAGNRTLLTDTTGQIEFYNIRAAAFWKLRDMLDPARGAQIMLPDDEDLAADLSTPKWKTMPGGKIVIELKDDIKKRIGRSPDLGDAVVLAFWAGAGAVMVDYDQAAFDWVTDGSVLSDDSDALEWERPDSEESVFSQGGNLPDLEVFSSVPDYDWNN